MKIKINRQLEIPENELEWNFVRGSGPGGQNVNRVASAVQLRFNVRKSPSLPEPVRRRLLRLARNRINLDGVLIIEAKSRRSQERNRGEARDRLKELLLKAARPPKKRIRTSPSRAARERRLQSKKRRSEKKRQRRFNPGRDLP